MSQNARQITNEYDHPTLEDRQYFLYDKYEKLYKNLNRIKQLQLFTISSYYVDFVGNQWFLYKPKYENFVHTDNELKIYNFYGDNAPNDDIDLKNIKSSKKFTDHSNVSGELWVRLKNFPFAYPVEFNTTCIIKANLWRHVLSGNIYKFKIVDNFGFIYYTYNNNNCITFFLINEEYKRDAINLTSFTNVEDGVLKGDNTLYPKEVFSKLILIDPLKTYKFKDNETFIDCIFYNGRYYIFYHDDNLPTSCQISMTNVDNSDTGLITEITKTNTISLPKYDINGRNICQPSSKTNWAVSISADNVNIAYESIPIH